MNGQLILCGHRPTSSAFRRFAVTVGVGLLALLAYSFSFSVSASADTLVTDQRGNVVPVTMPRQQDDAKDAKQDESDRLQVATLGAGCFWCVEAVFLQIAGVEKVVSGFSGGRVENPTYKQVMTGRTGHAEVVQIHFDPEKVSFEKLLEVFWTTHDPTTRNRQGPDVGTQYRSVIFYHNEDQKNVAEDIKKKLDAAKVFNKRIVTEISEYSAFYPAEDYHQNYYFNNPYQDYCRVMIAPKVSKVRQVFADILKE
ncbi:MAG TPA: peptide-methionine (S)-S-oxide reductase MsrA [Pirellulaceae bacterium]|nr:peptide-methionine (S)-S-oxide reductase MsrA [Pirellulaceae bacterium]